MVTGGDGAAPNSYLRAVKMKNCRAVILSFVACLSFALSSSFSTSGQNWPSFRGPSGVAEGSTTPVKWDADSGSGIEWKAAIPGRGNSSPVIWGNKVFVTSAVSITAEVGAPGYVLGDMTSSPDAEPHSWRVYCFDKYTGKLIWQRVAHEGKPKNRRHPLNTFATPTPVVDGKHLVVFFGSEGLYCYDLDGTLLWKKDLGVLKTGYYADSQYQWAVGSSPIIYRDLVILQCDVYENAFLAAYKVETGEVVWRVHREDNPSWSTPTIYEDPHHVELITCAPHYVRAYNPANGEELWRLKWDMDIHTSAPITGKGLIFVSSGKHPSSPSHPLYAIKPGGKGDISLPPGTFTSNQIAWSKSKAGTITTTPLLYGDYLYTLTDAGVLRCFHASDGALQYEQRVATTTFFASPVAADGKIYISSMDGDIYVIKAGADYELLATNSMAEACLPSPAISEGLLFIRTAEHLFCIKIRGRSDDTAFLDVTSQSGITYRNEPPLFDRAIRHINSLWASFISPVTVGDFDNDGLDDIFLVSSSPGLRNALYRNKGNFTFEDVTEKSGLKSFNNNGMIATGALWFDYDNDGKLDLWVIRLGTNLLFKNNGDGTFSDTTAQANIGKQRRNNMAVIAFDYNNDGFLDVLTGGFFDDRVDLFNLENAKFLPDDARRAANGGSKVLYRNNGDGTFTDVTERAGIRDTGFTTALGHADYNNDGWQDFYIANDWGPDRLYRNNGDSTFTDVTKRSTALDTRRGMNVDFGDYDNDGLLDIYVTNITESWMNECNMLWRNIGDEIFVDLSRETETCNGGWGWGAKFLDYDNDGRLDIYAANGFISAGPDDYIEDMQRIEANPDSGFRLNDGATWPALNNKSFAGYEQNHLFHNVNGELFKDVSSTSGANSLLDGRGVAIADFDNDGAMDLVVANSGREIKLYRNQQGLRNNWLELRLTGRISNRNAIGTRVKLTIGNVSQIREVNCGNGYQSQSTLRLHFGVGANEKIDSIEIRWPRGWIQRFNNPRVNQILTVTEGFRKRAAIISSSN